MSLNINASVQYRGASAVLGVDLPVCGLQLGSRDLLHDLTHKQPGITLIPEVAHGHVMSQPLVRKGKVPERETHSEH